MSEESGAAAEAPAVDAGTPAEGGNVQVESNTPVGNETSGERPEWLPEKFKTPADFAQSYKELEAKIREPREAIRAEIAAELEQAAAKAPEKYELPEGLAPEAVEGNKQWEAFTDWAKQNNLSQEQVNEITSFYQANMAEIMPDLETEKKALGPNADSRIEAVTNWAGANLPEAEWHVVEELGRTAAGIQFLEKYVMKAQTRVADGEPPAASSPQDKVNEAKSMMQDPRYWDPRRRDTNFVSQVDKLFQDATRTSS